MPTASIFVADMTWNDLLQILAIASVVVALYVVYLAFA
jgi:hypothetical protein